MCGRSPEHFTLFSWTAALGGLEVGVVEFQVRPLRLPFTRIFQRRVRLPCQDWGEERSDVSPYHFCCTRLIIQWSTVVHDTRQVWGEELIESVLKGLEGFWTNLLSHLIRNQINISILAICSWVVTLFSMCCLEFNTSWERSKNKLSIEQGPHCLVPALTLLLHSR